MKIFKFTFTITHLDGTERKVRIDVIALDQQKAYTQALRQVALTKGELIVDVVVKT